MRVVLDVEMMYYYKLTPEQVCQKVKMHKGRLGLYECVVSLMIETKIVPIDEVETSTKYVVYLDIYPDQRQHNAMLKELKLKPKYQQVSRISQIFLQNVFIPEMPNMILAGIEGIKSLEIASTRYDFGITDENQMEELSSLFSSFDKQVRTGLFKLPNFLPENILKQAMK